MRHMVGINASGMRRGILLLVVVLAMAACSETSPTTTPAPPATTVTTTPPTTTSTTSTTTTMAATTTTVDPLARPEVLISNVNRDSIDDFDTTGDDLYRISLELLDLFSYLEGSPTSDASKMVALMFERDYPHWDPILVSFLELSENPGWHYTDPGLEPLGVRVLNVSGDLATVQFADVRGEQIIEDVNGTVVKTYPGWAPELTTVTLRRGVDGKWRFADAEPSIAPSDSDLSALVKVEWEGRGQ